MKRTILNIMIMGMFAGASASLFANDSAQDGKRANNAGPATTEVAPQSQSNTSKPEERAADSARDGAAKTRSSEAYKAAQDSVKSQFSTAKARCDLMSGDAGRACLADARAERTKAMARVDQQWGTDTKSKDKSGKSETRSEDGSSAQVGGAPDTRSDAKQGPVSNGANGNVMTTSEGAADGKSDYAAATDKAQIDYRDAKAKCDVLEGAANGRCVSDAKQARSAAIETALAAWDTQGMATLPDAGTMERSNRGMEAQGGMKPDAADSVQKPAGQTSQ